MLSDRSSLNRKLKSIKVPETIFRYQGLVITGLMVFILSIAALTYNELVTGYPGNNYFPPKGIQIYMSLLLCLAGFSILHGRNAKTTSITRELIILVSVYFLIALSINAIQYTPFQPIDEALVSFEAKLYSFYLPDSMAWAHQFPTLNTILNISYKSLDWQLLLTPLILIAFAQPRIIREYYFLLLFTSLIGFSVYYFFPTTAPASIFQSPFFEKSQYATGLKFWQIHHHIQPTTIAGGMISIPSFHVIFAWICLYSLRQWKWLFMLLLINNLFLFASCVLLGWHYLIDIFASFTLLVSAHFCYQKQNINFKMTKVLD